MNSRSRLIITAVVACHLFLAPRLLTSQFLFAQSSEQQQVPGSSQSQSTGSASSENSQSHNDQPSLNAPATEATPSTQQTPETSTKPSPSSRQQPPATVVNDDNEEDTSTEQIIQQEIQSSDSQQLGPPRPAMNVQLGRDEVLIRGDEQEKNQDIYKVRGHVEIRFRTYILHADEATYDSTTGQVTATGHVVFDGGPHHEHIVGTHCTYDVSRDTGTFYDVTGSTGVRFKNKMMFLVSSTPFFFTGKVVEKLGPDTYRVHQGTITSCQLPKPKWDFQSATSLIEVGNEASMHHATLRIHNIPIFYFPFVEHPIDNLGRKSGFLIPVIGISNSRGTILGDAYYWAINRNSDATIGAEYYSKRGWAQHGEYRSVGYKYRFQAEYFGVIDEKGYPSPPIQGQNQGGEELKAIGDANLGWGFRGVVNVDYLSSYLFRLAFGQSFADAINSEVRSSGFVSKNFDGYAFGVYIGRYQDYTSTDKSDVIDIAHTPTLEFSSVERPLWNTPLVYSYDLAAEGLSRHEPGFETNGIVGRVDADPYVAIPRFLRGWTFRPELGLRETYYTEQLDMSSGSTGPVALNSPFNRFTGNASFEVRPPVLSRIFDHKLFGYVMKNTIEPEATYRYQTGVHDFTDIIRFDERDILADDDEVEYGVTTRLYAKRAKSRPDCYRNPRYKSLVPEDNHLLPEKDKREYCDDQQGPAKEFLTWKVAQKYFFDPNFGGAIVPGQPNVFDSSVDLTAIAFVVGPRRFSPLVSRLSIQNGPADFYWAIDYDPVLHQVNVNTIFAGYRWRNWYTNAGETYLNIPGQSYPGTNQPDVYNQFRYFLGYGNVSRKGINSAATIGYDFHQHYLQYAASQTTYNWDCCGVTFEYRRWLIPGVRNENYYRFALSLANFGTFGNIRRQDRLY